MSAVEITDQTAITVQIQSLPFARGFVTQDANGKVIRATDDAWRYVDCIVRDADGNDRVLPPSAHPDWGQIYHATAKG